MITGLKSNGSSKELHPANAKFKAFGPSFAKTGYPLPPIKTGTATVVTPPKLRTESLGQEKHESLQRIWTIRNKLKSLKKDHHHFGICFSYILFKVDFFFDI